MRLVPLVQHLEEVRAGPCKAVPPWGLVLQVGLRVPVRERVQRPEQGLSLIHI